MDEMRNKIIDYLRRHNAMSLATTCDERPHAATVFYVNDQIDLYFISNPSSRHGQHLASNNRVAATVNEDYRNWNDIKGLQLQGHVEQIGPLSANKKIADAFVDKFPDTSRFFIDPEEMPDAVAGKVAKVRFYRMQATRIFYIDNSLGFGHREELPMEGSTTLEE
jgi:uncharacterized protein YhbP (UPF0306 family)